MASSLLLGGTWPMHWEMLPAAHSGEEAPMATRQLQT